MYEADWPSKFAKAMKPTGGEVEEEKTEEWVKKGFK